MQPTSEQQEQPAKLSEEQLREIYPTPKTYDEMRADRAKIDAVLRARHTKHPRLAITGLIIIVIAGLLPIALTALSLMLTLPMLGVPMVMLLSVVWFFGMRASIAKIRTIIDTNPNL